MLGTPSDCHSLRTSSLSLCLRVIMSTSYLLQVPLAFWMQSLSFQLPVSSPYCLLYGKFLFLLTFCKYPHRLFHGKYLFLLTFCKYLLPFAWEISLAYFLLLTFCNFSLTFAWETYRFFQSSCLCFIRLLSSHCADVCPIYSFAFQPPCWCLSSLSF